jgi:glycosyltransferase involved in cell wall biosynthesis
VEPVELRALQVVGNLDRGGAQEVVRTLARFLPEAGCVPVVATLRDGPLRPEIEELGVAVEVIGGRTASVAHLSSFMSDVSRIQRRLEEVAERHRTNVLQTHLLHTLDFLMPALRGSGPIRAVFWTVHNSRLQLRRDQLAGASWALTPKRVAHRTLYRLLSRRVDGLIAVSSDVARAVRREYRVPRSKVAVIPNGVDLDRFEIDVDRDAVRAGLGIHADAPVAIVVAKLLPQKGHRILLEALPAVLGRHPRMRFLLVGEGALADSLREQIRRAGLEESVQLLGPRRDIPELLAASDLFVLPSLWEGLPMALLEAMASGLPVVASDVSGTREVVQDGESGLLVPAGDVSALAAAMSRLLADREMASRLGQAGRRRVEACYSASAQARQHVELYRYRLQIPS